MPKTKIFSINIPAILICVIIVFASAFFINASSSTTQFTADTIISLSGIDDGDLQVRINSECASLIVDGAVLTITDIPVANNFIFKTTSHNNALKLTPSENTLDLTLNSINISSGNISEWTLNADTGTTVAHIVGVANANTWYAIKTDGTLFNTFQSNSLGEVSFTYNGSWSEKVFTIEVDSTNPTEFSLIAPINNSSTSNSNPTFSWNVSSDPDISYYQLYIDNTLDTDNISTTSLIPTNALSCGAHTWFVKAIDNAGNSTNSDSFSLSLSCGGTPVWMLEQMNQNNQEAENNEEENNVDENENNENQTIPGGSLIRAINQIKVYITKEDYKRHIADSEIFNFYGHLNWDSIQEINLSVLNSYQESFLIRAISDYKVYEIKNRIKHWLNITVEEFINRGYDWNEVFIVNEEERDWYETGKEIK